MYRGSWLFRYSNVFGIIVMVMFVFFRWNKDVRKLLILLLISFIMNGFMKCRFILKMVGLLILRKVDKDDGRVSVLSFVFFVFNFIVK